MSSLNLTTIIQDLTWEYLSGRASIDRYDYITINAAANDMSGLINHLLQRQFLDRYYNNRKRVGRCIEYDDENAKKLAQNIYENPNVDRLPIRDFLSILLYLSSEEAAAITTLVKYSKDHQEQQTRTSAQAFVTVEAFSEHAEVHNFAIQTLQDEVGALRKQSLRDQKQVTDLKKSLAQALENYEETIATIATRRSVPETPDKREPLVEQDLHIPDPMQDCCLLEHDVDRRTLRLVNSDSSSSDDDAGLQKLPYEIDKNTRVQEPEDHHIEPVNISGSQQPNGSMELPLLPDIMSVSIASTDDKQDPIATAIVGVAEPEKVHAFAGEEHLGLAGGEDETSLQNAPRGTQQKSLAEEVKGCQAKSASPSATSDSTQLPLFHEIVPVEDVLVLGSLQASPRQDSSPLTSMLRLVHSLYPPRRQWLGPGEFLYTISGILPHPKIALVTCVTGVDTEGHDKIPAIAEKAPVMTDKGETNMQIPHALAVFTRQLRSRSISFGAYVGKRIDVLNGGIRFYGIWKPLIIGIWLRMAVSRLRAALDSILTLHESRLLRRFIIKQCRPLAFFGLVCSIALVWTFCLPYSQGSNAPQTSISISKITSGPSSRDFRVYRVDMDIYAALG